MIAGLVAQGFSLRGLRRVDPALTNPHRLPFPNAQGKKALPGAATFTFFVKGAGFPLRTAQVEIAPTGKKNPHP